MVRVAPSILSADFGSLAAAVDLVAPVADWLHVDVMDGHFVPNLTIGPPVVRSLRRHTGLFFDCHLMISEPARYLRAFREAGADGCTVHVEVGDTSALLSATRELGMRAGVALNPETPADAVLPLLGKVDLVLVMTVHPGFGGQSFLAEVVPKVAAVRAELDRIGSAAVLEVDGGIDERTAPLVVGAGATVLVAGSAVFGDPDPRSAVERIQLAGEAGVGGGAAVGPASGDGRDGGPAGCR